MRGPNCSALKHLVSVTLLVTMTLASTILYSLSFTPSEAQTSNACSSQPTSIYRAIGSQPENPPANAIDNNLDTRWSNLGLGSWIQLYAGSGKVICSVDIAWYRGNLRQNTFDISIWNPNIQKWVNVFSGTSSGTTAGFETYDFADVSGAYIMVRVHGNTENTWASISEIDVNGYTGSVTCDDQALSVHRAIGSEPGNPPSNAIDNNLNTMWSNNGDRSWIQLYAGLGKVICNVDIAWYRGDARQYNFDISIWNPNIKKWVIVFSGISSGTTSGFERYNFANLNGAYIMIRIDGNADDNQAAILELDINGYVGSTRWAGGNGDGGGGTGGGAVDKFGIKKIYPTKAGGEEWFMDMTDGQDPRSRPPSMTKNPDGSFKVTSSQVRYGVFTSSGYKPDEVVLDHGILAQRGYMQSPNDWKNVELTGYVKVNSGQSGENFAWYARGGRHTGSGNPEGCEGSAYKPDLFYDGRVRFAKEQWHVSYVFTDHKRPMDSIEDRWVGFKGIMWNMEQNGETVVKMEIWVDNNEDSKQDGPWVKVDENIDSGGWGNSDEECGGEPDQIITWGGPIATFRWDGASDVDIKNFSVREIQPSSQ